MSDQIEVKCRKCGKSIIWTSAYGDTCKECSEKIASEKLSQKMKAFVEASQWFQNQK